MRIFFNFGLGMQISIFCARGLFPTDAERSRSKGVRVGKTQIKLVFLYIINNPVVSDKK